MSDPKLPKNSRPYPRPVEKRVVKLNEGSKKARLSAARLAAVQVLYQIKLSGHKPQEALMDFINNRIGFEIDGDVLVPADRDLLTDIVNGVSGHRLELGEIIEGHLKNHGKTRVDDLLEAVLYCGAYELMAHQDTDAPIILADYMNVVHAFYEDGAPKMINAMLDAIASSLRGPKDAD